MQENESVVQENSLSSVYVIYGNDTILRDEIYELLQKNGLQPITKRMATNWTYEGAPLTNRVIDAAFEHAQTVLVHLSAAEKVRLRESLRKVHDPAYETDFSPQPTLDQIFEAGYAFGKCPEHTILLRTENVRPFSDIAGRAMITLTEEDAYGELIDRLRSISNNVKHVLPRGKAAQRKIATDPRKVFVIHGRDKHHEEELFKFINMLNLAPISWREAVKATKNRAPYTGEILEAFLKEAQAVVVLLTGDDETTASADALSGKKHHKIYLPRPNVVFEAGMSFSNQRLAKNTILVQTQDVKIWNAIDGLDRIKLSDEMKDRWNLITSLKEAGCPVRIPSNELVRRTGHFGVWS